VVQVAQIKGELMEGPGRFFLRAWQVQHPEDAIGNVFF